MYAGPIIDPHHHLWDLSLGKHAWLAPDAPGGALPGIERVRHDCLPADYLRASAKQTIVATVHIEAQWDAADPVGETRWLEALEKPRGIAARYVAAAPFGTAEAARVIEAQAGFARVAGIRAMLSFHPAAPEKSFAPRAGIAADPAWRRDIALLAPRNLHLELMMYPYQLAEVRDLARALPDLSIIVNHCASPIDQDAAGLRRWRDSVRALAALPNVALKISNVKAYDPDAPYERVRVIVLHCIDCFGPARAMFATDWPVAGLYAGFDEIYDTFRRCVADMAEAEQRALFHDTAARLYRIG